MHGEKDYSFVIDITRSRYRQHGDIYPELLCEVKSIPPAAAKPQFNI